MKNNYLEISQVGIEFPTDGEPFRALQNVDLGIAKGEHGPANGGKEKQADSETLSLAKSLTYIKAYHGAEDGHYKNGNPHDDSSFNSINKKPNAGYHLSGIRGIG